MYTTIKDAYRLNPAHISAASVQTEIRVWLEGAFCAFQDCFDTKDWSVLREAATYCVVMWMIILKMSLFTKRSSYDQTRNPGWQWRSRGNWMRVMLNVPRTAHLTRIIQIAKFAYAQKIQSHFHNIREKPWKGIQQLPTITLPVWQWHFLSTVQCTLTLPGNLLLCWTRS